MRLPNGSRQGAGGVVIVRLVQLWLSPQTTRGVPLLIIALTLSLGGPLAVLVVDRLRRHGATWPGEWHEGAGVSVIIPCHNVQEEIGPVVQSVLDESPPFPLEVILVENGSRDRTFEVTRELEQAYPSVRAVSVSPPPGHKPTSVAMNYGLTLAHYPTVVRLDSDTRLVPGALVEACAPILSGEAVAVACNVRIRNENASVWTRFQSLDYFFAMEVERRVEGLYECLACCSGAMSAFRRDFLLEAGGYELDPKGSEDMEATLKMHRFGHIAMAPSAIGLTDGPTTLGALVAQRRRWARNGVTALYLHRRDLFRKGYGVHSLMAFVGLPLRYFHKLWSTFGVIVKVLGAVALSQGHTVRLVELIGAYYLFRSLVLATRMSLLAPALGSPASLRQAWLLPAFSAVYMTILDLVNVVGFVDGIQHIITRRPAKGRRTPGPSLPSAPDAQPGPASTNP